MTIAYGAPFDNCNPPARLFFEGGFPSVDGYNYTSERQWAQSCTERYRRNPAVYARPMYIVKLKAWKFAEPQP